jgi:DNA-binding GntR family transcriptional regulator
MASYVDGMDDQASVVDPNSPVYVYVQVADDIQARIKAGQLQPGARLPGERELADQYRIAYGTARRVIQELRDRGLAQTVASKGTFIVGPPATEG